MDLRQCNHVDPWEIINDRHETLVLFYYNCRPSSLLKRDKKIRSHLMVVTVVRVVSFLRDGRDIPN